MTHAASVPRGSTSAPQQKKFSSASNSMKVVVAEHAVARIHQELAVKFEYFLFQFFIVEYLQLDLSLASPKPELRVEKEIKYGIAVAVGFVITISNCFSDTRAER
jgi:hypothetical protein